MEHLGWLEKKDGSGLVLVNQEGEIEMQGQLILRMSFSNNEAKYEILVLGLKSSIKRGIEKLMVKGDALLIAK